METKAVYAGSFDPVTYGHLDIIERGSKLFSEVIVGVGKNIKKDFAFSLEERISLISESTKKFSNVKVTSFDNLLVNFAKENNCKVIIRGLRALTDFDYEFQLGLTNMDMDSSIETIFLLTNPKNIFISSSMVKEIALHGGKLSNYVPDVVEKKLKKRFG